MVKTRYLQVSDVMMFEYNMLGENDVNDIQRGTSFITTTLMDEHKLIFTPVSYECELDVKSVGYKKMSDLLSLNNINHMALPKDRNSSMFYYFIDDDYSYVSNDIMNRLSQDNQKVIEYSKYLKDGNLGKFEYYDGITDVRWDNMRLYFVNGYDFSNIYGLYVKIYADTNTDGKYVDLCDFFFTKDNAFSLMKFLSSPIIFGNNIYDRYVELNLPCIYDLINNQGNTSTNLFRNLDIKADTTLKLNFAYVLEHDKEIESINRTVTYVINNNSTVEENVNCIFTKSSSLKGTIPTQNINSDNIGCYISESPDSPYIEFYGTWKGKPLDCDTVWQFNKGIRLYDSRLVRRMDEYEVSSDYTAQYDLKRWVAMHELKLSFCMDDTIIKEESYNMSQIFIDPNSPVKFYYRPLIFDENVGLYVNTINIVYTLRFINVNDKVQFVKVGTLSLAGDVSKYYAKGTSLKFNQTRKYQVNNKIVENKQEVRYGNNPMTSTKYIKVFYDTTNVVLTDGADQYGTYGYTLTCSQSPKSYKFVFKKAQDNGAYDYMDLTDGYYKLLFKDESGSDNIIEPTYSSNMNLYLGEIEFNFSSSMINKLMNIEETKRKMSIISYGEDGSVSSMYDFNYTF